jgi:hypothetical protein
MVTRQREVREVVISTMLLWDNVVGMKGNKREVGLEKSTVFTTVTSALANEAAERSIH